MLFPEHFLAVRATVTPEHEDLFNRWYNSEHVPDAVNMLPGCIGASRYKVVVGDGSPPVRRALRISHRGRIEVCDGQR